MNYKEKYKRWIQDEVVDEITKKELQILSEKEIVDRFYADLEFGTGGLRGVMATGTNRMNVYTVRLATQGLANEILDREGAAEKGVVIAYDSRNNSELFAKECARVLCANGRRCGKSCVNSIKTDLLGENYGRNNFYQGGFST